MFNTTFEDVYDVFLSMITSYEFVEYTQDELSQELQIHLKKSIAKFIHSKDMIADYDMEEFNRVLTDLEITIIATGILYSWLQAKVYSIALLKQQLSSKDYQTYSNANHLKQLMDLKKSTDREFNYWSQRYSLQKFGEK